MTARVRATIVVDLGFGDAGKGLLTDWLVRETGATLVVRYNGGAQAGHNVVTADGRHHTFSQLGAGGFVPGVRTLLGPRFVLHPTALLAEAEALAAKGVGEPLSRLAVHRAARVVTPYHQALGRLRELARGGERHGSCGVGIGETVADHLARPGEGIVAGHLAAAGDLARRLVAGRDRLRRQAEALLPHLPPSPAVDDELAILHREDVEASWLDAVGRVAERLETIDDPASAERLAVAAGVVFEGAQGVLLDERHGFHPHTTWGDCTTAGAREMLAAVPGAEVETLGVLRGHAVRHGAGPLPTEDAALSPLVHEHNGDGPWQGAVRHGWFDAVLCRYALAAIGGVDRLAITHLDLLERLPTWRRADAYRWAEETAGRDLVAERGPEGTCRRLAPPPRQDLPRQERLARLLARAEPVYVESEADEDVVLAAIEAALGRPVAIVSRGPTAGDVATRC